MYCDQYCIFALLRQAEVLQDHSRERSRINPTFCRIMKTMIQNQHHSKDSKAIIISFVQFSDTFIRVKTSSPGAPKQNEHNVCHLL
jgi:hypothetical protein